jgi:RNA polymerase sigma factor (sigma-70 family)
MVSAKQTSEVINAKVKELLLAYRSGNINRDDAFSEILGLVHPRIIWVLHYVYGIQRATEQDDLFQEVMLRFVRSERAYDFEQPILPWLYQIARNVKRDSIRRSHKIRTEQLDGHRTIEGNPGLLEAAETSQWLHHLKKRLHGDQSLEEFIDAAALIDGAHSINQQLAEILKTTTSDVVNRRKRILRVLGGQPPMRGETVKGWLHRLSEDYFRRDLVKNERLPLENAIAGLLESERHILWLKYFDCYTDQEIAELLKIKPILIKHYLRQALRKLRKLLRSRDAVAPAEAGHQTP